MNESVEILRRLGFDVPDDITDILRSNAEGMLDGMDIPGEFMSMLDEMSGNMSPSEILAGLGMGKFDYETGEWTPTSDQIYAFDAEVSDIDMMYTLFLKGIESIVPGLTVADIIEDLSNLTEDVTYPDDIAAEPPSDGMRSVSFTCNGNTYAAELKSYCDWINLDIVEFMNSILEQLGFDSRLHVISSVEDQIVLMIYASSERAELLRNTLMDY